jgi:hypothetical protein
MSPQASWILKEEVYPRLISAVPRVVRCIGSEDAHELIQDATVMAAQMINRVDKQGKLGKVKGSNIAYYTIQHMKSGRRASGSSCVDVYGSGTQLGGRSDVQSLQEVVSEDTVNGYEIFELQDVISNDTEDPSLQAARNLDWKTLCQSLDTIEMQLVECICSGMTVREICQKIKTTKRKLLELQHQVARKVLEIMGTDILRDIAVIPKWKIGLDCELESRACRSERRANV